MRKILRAIKDSLLGTCQTVSMSSVECRVNGKTTQIQGNNISICNGRVFVDGVEQSDRTVPGVTKVIVQGSVSTLCVDQCSVTVEGSCGDIESEQCSVTVKGNVTGNIKGSQCSINVAGRQGH